MRCRHAPTCDLPTRAAPLDRIRDAAIRAHPAFASGEVHCMTCGRGRHVDAERCLRDGWPTCCGATMQLGRRVEALGGTSASPTRPPFDATAQAVALIKRSQPRRLNL